MVKEEKAVEQTVSSKLWDKIKDLPIDIFALPNQTIKDHIKREEGMEAVFPNDVYVTLRSAAAYPALEEALGTAQARNQVRLAKGERFELSQSARYTVIKVVSNL
jgi:hypothetical protein